MSNPYRRKLLAIGYQNPDTFNVHDDKEVFNIVIWLEDQKIRHYKIEERGDLRNYPAATWKKAFGKYLQELNCPYQVTEKTAVMDWLLGYAVRLEYGDNVDKYKALSAGSAKEIGEKDGQPQSTNPLDNMDFDDPSFKAGIISLAQMLQVPPHPDELEILKAICLLVTEKLSKEAIEKAISKGKDETQTIPLDKTDLGFEAGDYIMSDAAKIIRLLQIKDLRDLQNNINSAIVAVQAIIANPKTDSRLGKVGRMG